MATKDLTINAPRQGIAQSPHIGFGDIRNLDISSIPGVVSLNKKMTITSGTITTPINWLVRHPVTTTEIYALGNTGIVYKSTDSGGTFAALTGYSTTNAHGNGMCIFKNYLIVARDGYLDYCGDGTATGIITANWNVAGWQTVDSDVLWHPMMVSKLDGRLYGGAGKWVFTLEEVAGQTFAPGTGATFNWTQQHLDLPTGYRIKTLEELGNNLEIGTWQGTAVTDIRVADIFPWSGSASIFGDTVANVYGQPVVLSDYGIHSMFNIGNSLVLLHGTNGDISRCDGVNVYPIGKVPGLTGSNYYEYYPGSITQFKNKIFFGVSGGGTSTTTDGCGVYSLTQTGQGNILNLEHTISTGGAGATTNVKITAILPITSSRLLVAWKDATSYGIDLTDTVAYPIDYSGYFDSPLYVVGSALNKRSFSELEFQFAKKLATGEGIKVSYRVNLTDTPTEIGTYTYATLGDAISHNVPVNIPACEMLQIRVALCGTATTTPFLKSVTLR